ncbi:MAG: helix-turn-helix domain-containing protein [Parvibaculaceae bacterium]|nr:helix-turn-helix domain-containing protein [Parvibaculaceae bacterium]HBM89804.1 DNA-binding protein [Rhodobiaceae bacterium]|tara:strand:- start:2234 stop:2464 length:231 start_codon:yes stop_codon:yes gene_type:complete
MRENTYLTTKTLAEYAHTSTRTLERWRSEGVGPPFRKWGHKVLYSLDDVEAYLDANRHDHTSQYATKAGTKIKKPK